MLRSAFVPLVLSTLLLAGPAARGGTLATTPVLLKTGDGIMCIITNTGTKDARAVSVEVLEWDDNGLPVPVTTTTPADLAPLGLVQASDLATELSPVFGACRFTFKGSAKGLRASANVLENGSDLLDTQPAH